MDEIQIDTFMSGIEEEMNLLRVMERAEVFLTDSQKDEIKKLPKAEREAAKKTRLQDERSKKRERMMLLICALENKIKNSNLPPEAKKSLENVVQQAKDNGWKFSPQDIDKVAEIKEKEMAEPEEKKRKEQEKIGTDIATAIITGAAVAVAATSIAAVIPEPAPAFTKNTKTVQKVSGVFMLPDDKKDMNPEYVEKVMAAGQKALEEIKTPAPENISIAAIKSDTSLLPIQKHYAEAVALELRPDIKKDMLTEDHTLKTIAIQKSLARHARKQAKREGRPVQKQEHKRPDWTPQEALVMKRVNKIKQSAGTILSMEEIKEKLEHPALIRIYEARMRKDHPEFFAEQTKYAQMQKVGLTSALAKAAEKPHKRAPSIPKKLHEELKAAQTPRKSKLHTNLEIAEEKPHKKRKTLQTAIKGRAVQNARKKIA